MSRLTFIQLKDTRYLLTFSTGDGKKVHVVRRERPRALCGRWVDDTQAVGACEHTLLCQLCKTLAQSYKIQLQETICVVKR